MPRPWVALWVAVGAFTGAAACGGDSNPPARVVTIPDTPTATDSTLPLRVLAPRRNLLVGSAIDAGFRFTGSDGVEFKGTMVTQFNLLTPENDLKHDHVHPQQNVYNFAPADSIVAFAAANGMKARGHTLIAPTQVASWMANGSWTQAQAQQLLDDHVTTVVSHYRGQLMEWDVVNEALADDGSIKPSIWYNTIGRGYIERAFRDARAADSTVGLFYNDYNIEGVNAKSDSVYAMVQDFQARGVPITGIGLQSHFQVGGVPSTMAANIARFAALGLQVHITELDVRVPLPSTSSELAAQAQDYATVFSTCLQYPACSALVMWGFTDKVSWVPSTFPGWGDALIFDANYQPKPAFGAIVNVLK